MMPSAGQRACHSTAQVRVCRGQPRRRPGPSGAAGIALLTLGAAAGLHAGMICCEAFAAPDTWFSLSVSSLQRSRAWGPPRHFSQFGLTAASNADVAEPVVGRLAQEEFAKEGKVAGSTTPASAPDRKAWVRIAFAAGLQGALFPLAVLVGRLLRFPGPLAMGSSFSLAPAALVVGSLSAAPLVLQGGILVKLRSWLPETSAAGNAVRELLGASESLVAGLLGKDRRLPLALIAATSLGLTAGLWEELVFRGLLQRGLISGGGLLPGLPAMVGVLIGAVIFGLLHAMTPLYFALATLSGAYLGWLLLATDNLAVPIIAHAVYDFVAILGVHCMITSRRK